MKNPYLLHFINRIKNIIYQCINDNTENVIVYVKGANISNLIISPTPKCEPYIPQRCGIPRKSVPEKMVYWSKHFLHGTFSCILQTTVKKIVNELLLVNNN